MGSALVVFGLVLESDWAAGWRALGAAAVIVGVAIETLLDGGILLASHKLEMLHNQELEAMRLETAQANARADEARCGAAEANEKAERERLERMKIEQRLAPRRLTANEQARITAKLAKLGPIRATVFEPKEDPEIRVFAFDIMGALSEAGWRATTAMKFDWGRVVIGVAVEVNETNGAADQRTWKVADALATALKAERVLTQGPMARSKGMWGFTSMHNGDDLDAPIQIIVGSKP